MKRLVISIVVSILLSHIVGLGLSFVLFPSRSLYYPDIMFAGVMLSVILNINFFYIRRWEGCIERLGGLTFTAIIMATLLLPFLLLGKYVNAATWQLFVRFATIMLVQLAGIGLIATHFLRARNYKPPKPGEKLSW